MTNVEIVLSMLLVTLLVAPKLTGISSRLKIKAKALLGMGRRNYTEARLLAINDAVNISSTHIKLELNHIKGQLQTTMQLQQEVKEALSPQGAQDSHMMYIQSLATLSKGISTIIEKQEQNEKHFILIATALNRLTAQD